MSQNLLITGINAPGTATSCTSTNITALCQLGCGNFSFDSINYTISSNTIDIGVYYQSSGICLPVISFPTHTANLGNVPAGTYTISSTAYLNSGPTTTPTNTFTLANQLTVTSCCNAAASFNLTPGNICQNDSAFFQSTSTNAQSLEWYINNQFVSSDSGFTYLFDSAGAYNIKLIAIGNSCADSVFQTLVVDSIPQINLGPDRSFCEGDSIMFDAGPGWANVLWLDGSTGQSTYFGNGGNFSATVTDQNGCQNSDTVVLIETPAPVIEFGNEDTLICDDQFPLTFSATGPGYSYLWHDGSTDSVFVLNGSGWAACTVTDSNGCANYDSIFVIMLICDGLESERDNYLLIYPNPTKGALNILVSDINLSYKIFNEKGLEVQKGILRGGESKIELTDLKNGLYFLQTESNNTTIRKPFIIQ